jgi:hypothetical protein
MRKSRWRILFSLAATILIFLPSTIPGQAPTSEVIELCDFKVPTSVANANASFSVVYSIRVGPDGKALNVTKVKNDFLADGPFIDCLNGWILPTPGGNVSVTFSWQHSKGWIQVSLSGKGVNRMMRFQQGWCCSSR